MLAFFNEQMFYNNHYLMINSSTMQILNNHNKVNIFIFFDDERNIEDVFWNEKTKQMSEMSDKTFVVRNFAEFVDCIDKLKNESLDSHISLSLSLDHDLCDFHVRGRRCDNSNLKDELFQYGFQNKHGHNYVCTENLKNDDRLSYYEFTGYSCLKYLADSFADNKLNIDISNLSITVHSKNEIAKQTMINFIEWHWQSSYE